MEQIVQPTHNGVRVSVGESRQMDEETRRIFTDGDGVVHSVVFENSDTGERRFY